FIEQMQLHYDQQARDAGVIIVSACGLDSVPNDMGVVYLEKNFNGTLNSVESYMSVNVAKNLPRDAYSNGVLNYGTWESLVESLAHYSEIKPLRKKLFPERLPTFQPKLQARALPQRHVGGRGWSVPFLGADTSVVQRTQRRLHAAEHKRPVQFRAYLLLPGLLALGLYALCGALLMLMAKASFTKKLLLDYPQVFTLGYVTKKNPKKEVTENTKFVAELVGQGWPTGTDVGMPPSRTLTVRISVMDPGYGFTAAALLLCANAIVTEKEMIPAA
ncbi:hypothetical protein ACJJTC_019238, partial [Scirpophaga incertulas]